MGSDYKEIREPTRVTSYVRLQYLEDEDPAGSLNPKPKALNPKP